MGLGKGPSAKRIREDTSVPRDEGSSAPISNEGTDELITLEETASPGGESIPIETEGSNSMETPIETNNDDVIFQTVVEETGPLENVTILDFDVELTRGSLDISELLPLDDMQTIQVELNNELEGQEVSDLITTEQISIPGPSVSVDDEPSRRNSFPTNSSLFVNYDCPWCAFLGSDKGDLADHIKECHKALASSSQPCLRVCDECSNVFASKVALKTHIADLHSNNEIFTAPNETRIIMLRFRKLAWPCLVLGESGDSLKIRCFKDDKVLNIKKSAAMSFNFEKLEETKDTKMKKAFAKAISLLKS